MPTYTRPTDILADEILARLGNSGVALFSDLLARINQALGKPVEVRAQNPASTSVNIGVGAYTLPDMERIEYYEFAKVSELASGVIDYAAGTISTGGVSGFVLPTMTAGYYIKSLISYDVFTNSISVVFGAEASSVSGATVPFTPGGYQPKYMVELHSAAGGIGSWSNIGQDDIIRLISEDFPISPIMESQSVGGAPQSIFNLTTITIPADRNRLFIYINGVKCDINYTVTSDTQVTFATAIPANTRKVEFVVI